MDKAIKILHRKKVSLFTVNDAKKVFGVEKDNTLYKLLQRLEKRGVIERVKSGKYLFSLSEFLEFGLANFLVVPSYVSLESALSFYGILPQFPYTVTSVTTGKSKKVVYEEKEYEFVHLKSKYFFSFAKKDKFLIATPEKALLDELYFIAKKLRGVSLDDLDLTKINKNKLKTMAKRYDFIPLRKLLDEIC